MTSKTFLSYLEESRTKFPVVTVEELIQKAGGIENIYLVLVDILRGFCEQGALSSERVNEMVQPVKELAEKLQKLGLPSSNYIFLHDAHPENAIEFEAFASHCVRGSKEAEVVEALRPFQEAEGAQTFEKNATNGLFGKNREGVRFFEWLESLLQRKQSSVFLVVGDCTDLCIYQNAMGIRMLANERNVPVDVYVSEQHVRTYHLPVDTAEKIGVLAHDADLLDTVFLYHMKLNGINIVKEIK